jgi:Tol biopolymer transport system component
VARFGAPAFRGRNLLGGQCDVVDQAPATAEGEPPIAERLDSWKEIASFLGRGVRTVQRWEREEGLPVHRLEHARRGSVFAYRHELTNWWESRRSSLALAPASADSHVMPSRRTSLSRRTLGLVAVFAMGTAVTAIIFHYGAATERPAEYQVERLTSTSGITGWPAISADGRLVAYASDGGSDGSALDIWIQPVGGEASKLTDCAVSCMDPSFSADGTRVLYTAREPAGQSLYEVPLNGGQSRLLRRAARAGRWSPDGRWLAFISTEPPHGLHVATTDGTRVQALATDLVVGDFAVWSPDGRHLLIRAQPEREHEPDWWVIAPDTGAARNTQVLQWLRERGFAGRWQTELPPAWVEETSLVFSDGSNLWRQRLTAGLLQPRGEPEQLTRGALMAWFAAAGGGRVAFVSSNPDVNLRSVAIDPHSGVAFGPLRRVTRGSGMVQYPSLSSDGRTLAYSSSRSGNGDVFVRELGSANERALADTPAREAYATLSPSGKTVAYGIVGAGERAVRPIVLVNTTDGTSRQICADCRGRPRAWLDERTLIVERPATPQTSLAVLDVEDGSEEPLVESRQASVSNPRVAPAGRWIAFDVHADGRPPRVFIGSVEDGRPVPEDRWVLVAQQARYPFWSTSGNLLYYVSDTGDIRARRILPESGVPHGDPFQVFAPSELQLPIWLPGTAPVAVSNALLLVLADLRGDVWLIDLTE